LLFFSSSLGLAVLPVFNDLSEATCFSMDPGV
jgi:hypothetical protein